MNERVPLQTEPDSLTINNYSGSNVSQLDDSLATLEQQGTQSSSTIATTPNNRNGHTLSASTTSSDMTSSDVSGDPFDTREKLGIAPLAIIIFYGVSGGPFGVEETVRSAGSFYTLLGFFVMPFVWSVQEALMTAELGSAFPESAGCVAWVQEAFGDRMGWMSGYLSWISGATDNAIYPVLFVEYLIQLVGVDKEESLGQFARFLMFSSMSCLLAYANWLGLPLVGKMSMTICMVAMSPFVILVVVGAFKVDTTRWFTPPTVDNHSGDDTPVDLFSFAALSTISWRPFLNNLFWNLNSFDNAATFSADVENPGKVLPLALGWSVVMVSSSYLIPLLVALGASSAEQKDWVDGYFSVIAEEIAGPWLAGWLVFAAGISNIAQFQAELSSDAFQLLGMAERGYLPQLFATRSRHGTPTYGLLLGTLVIVCMSFSKLEQLIEMLNFNYALSLFLEYLSFIKLRISRPDLERPYRIPLSTVGCFILFIPSLTAILIVIALASSETYMFSIAVNALGLLIFSTRANAKSGGYQVLGGGSSGEMYT